MCLHEIHLWKCANAISFIAIILNSFVLKIIIFLCMFFPRCHLSSIFEEIKVKYEKGNKALRKKMEKACISMRQSHFCFHAICS